MIFTKQFWNKAHRSWLTVWISTCNQACHNFLETEELFFVWKSLNHLNSFLGLIHRKGPMKIGRHTFFARSLSSGLYASSKGMNLGPNLSSFGPERGLRPLSPGKPMWSSSTMRSPTLKSGLRPPAAAVVTSRRTPIKNHTRTGNAHWMKVSNA